MTESREESKQTNPSSDEQMIDKDSVGSTDIFAKTTDGIKIGLNEMKQGLHKIERGFVFLNEF